MDTISNRLKQALKMRNMKQADLVALTGIGKSSISTYISGEYEPKQKNLYRLAKALEVNEAWLMGYDVDMEPSANKGVSFSKYPEPRITEDIVTFPVIGEMAAGYEHIALEDWDGETIDIPVQYLHGRSQKDYMVLTVKGDSMYPLYLEGDKVLVLKQSTLNRSGEIGLIRYDGEIATLKKVEYVDGENWMKLIPLNPQYPPRMIEGEDLEQCEVLGIPRLIVREIKD